MIQEGPLRGPASSSHGPQVISSVSTPMKRIGQCRVFADHYQFYVLDSDADMFEGMPDWSDETVARGFIANEKVLAVGTKAHFNDHWVELWTSASAPETAGHDRAFAVDLSLPSGHLAITGLADTAEEVHRIPVPPGAYTVHVLASNLGIDRSSGDSGDSEDTELTDEELKARTDLERYTLVLVPKADAPC